MLYLIGGAPRCGKTKLAKMIARVLNISIFLTDEIRLKVLNETPKEMIEFRFPFVRMFNGDQIDECFEKYKPNDFLNADKIEARNIFFEIENLTKNKIEMRQDYIIEGVHLFPEIIKMLSLPTRECKLLYLGKIDESKILKGLVLNKDKDDWIIGHINKKVTLSKAANMVSFYGKYFYNEAIRYGVKFINTEDNFFAKLSHAAKYFLE